MATIKELAKIYQPSGWKPTKKMKKNVTILEIEDKVTQKGKPYCRIKTDTDGWMACFDVVAADHCKQHVGQNVSVEVKQSGEYMNLAKFYGAEDDTVVTEKVEPQPKSPAPAAVVNNNKNTTMYVSYAKDLVVGGIPMTEAIELIKEAQAAFS